MGQRANEIDELDEDIERNDDPAAVTTRETFYTSAYTTGDATADVDSPINYGDDAYDEDIERNDDPAVVTTRETAYTSAYTTGDTTVDVADADTSDAGDISSAVEAQRAEIEQTRAHLSETVDALKEKLNPQHLMEQAKETVREATIGRAEEAVSNAVDSAKEKVSDAGDAAKGVGLMVLETIKQNPIPAALVGIGLGWLYMNAKKQPSPRRYSDRYYEDYRRSGRSAGHYEDEEAERSPVRETLSRATDKVGEVPVRPGTRSAMSRIRRSRR